MRGTQSAFAGDRLCRRVYYFLDLRVNKSFHVYLNRKKSQFDSLATRGGQSGLKSTWVKILLLTQKKYSNKSRKYTAVIMKNLTTTFQIS